MQIIPLFTSIISLIFGITVIDQYFARRKLHQLLWAIGLFMYSLSAFTEFYWNKIGHVDFLYRTWYLVGAVLVAAYLGQGTVYLLMRGRRANFFMAVLGVFTLYAAVRVYTASIDISGLTSLTGVGVMPGDIRFVITPVTNAFGTFALVGGALYSAFIFWRKRIFPNRVQANILIAFGALLPAIGGTNLSTGSGTNLFFTLEFIGVIIMFIGFLRTKEVFGFFRFPLIHGFKKIEG
jgi:hypothetical protein